MVFPWTGSLQMEISVDQCEHRVTPWSQLPWLLPVPLPWLLPLCLKNSHTWYVLIYLFIHYLFNHAFIIYSFYVITEATQTFGVADSHGCSRAEAGHLCIQHTLSSYPPCYPIQLQHATTVIYATPKLSSSTPSFYGYATSNLSSCPPYCHRISLSVPHLSVPHLSTALLSSLITTVSYGYGRSRIGVGQSRVDLITS